VLDAVSVAKFVAFNAVPFKVITKSALSTLVTASLNPSTKEVPFAATVAELNSGLTPSAKPTVPVPKVRV
jgi:hypothetical protein